MVGKTIRVLDINLHEENPRHGRKIKKQEDIIKYLCDHEKVYNLARSIAKYGTNPLEKIGVVKKARSTQYYAAEGNRRICALKLLENPQLAPSGLRSKFSTLSANSVHPVEIDCEVFKTYDEARYWLNLTHTGANDGQGRKGWTADQQAHFTGKNRNTLALALLDFAEKSGFINASERKKTLTTATRFLSNPTFRKTIGIASSVSSADIKVGIPQPDFERALQRFSADLVSGQNGVTSRAKAKDCMAYAQTLKSTEAVPDLSNSTHLLTSVSPKKRPKKKRNKPSPNLRKYVIPSDYTPDINVKLLKRVFDELRKVNCDDFPFAAASLTRTMIEVICVDFHEEKLGKFNRAKGKGLHVCIDKVCGYIKSNYPSLKRAEKNAIERLRKAAGNDKDSLNPNSMGVYVHGGGVPDPKQLKSDWDTIQAGLDFMLKELP